MIDKARRKFQDNIPITMIKSNAEKLSFPDEQFDTIVVTLVFCSVGNRPLALFELKRALKLDGSILFLEYVKMEQPLFSGLQMYLHRLGSMYATVATLIIRGIN